MCIYQVIQGENVYAILRARRIASTEALVLSVPLRSVANKQKTQTGGGVALAIALAQVFKRKSSHLVLNLDFCHHVCLSFYFKHKKQYI